MTRKLAKVVTAEIAVVLQKTECKNVKSRFHVFHIYMAAVTLFQFCRAYGLKLCDFMFVCYPKTLDKSIKHWNNEAATVT